MPFTGIWLGGLVASMVTCKLGGSRLAVDGTFFLTSHIQRRTQHFRHDHMQKGWAVVRAWARPDWRQSQAGEPLGQHGVQSQAPCADS